MRSDLNRSYYISHHGVVGMKWGVRRFRNSDGTLTEKGKQAYIKDTKSFSKAYKKYGRKDIKYSKAELKFKKRAKKIAFTDTGVELKRRAGLKLARRYRSFVKTGERVSKKYEKMVKKYGIDSLSKEQIAAGAEVMERLTKLR